MRNTPTCVGKTSGGAHRQPDAKKHPHVRGEDDTTDAQGDDPRETPPRAWGRLAQTPVGGTLTGNTPTCVGKTFLPSPQRRDCKKHPHVRGEDQCRSPSRAPERETPPRAWGRPTGFHQHPSRRGNTPTCVGKTPSINYSVIIFQKHPHVRGEDATQHFAVVSYEETPPRAWGRLFAIRKANSRRRNTPTCVGKTKPCALLAGQSRKHPHVRGEDDALADAGEQSGETPPRAWGRPTEIIADTMQMGNTPTCVGKTSE